MDWPNERYIRLYTRDTGDWVLWPWETRALFCFILRKCDRAGLIQLGKGNVRALAALVGMPEESVSPALEPLISDGCVQIRDGILCVPNYIKAQETPQSDAARKQASREKARAAAMSSDVTRGHAESHAVTNGHSYPCLSVPIRAVPDLMALDAPKPKVRRGSRLAEDWEPTAGQWEKTAEVEGFSESQMKSEVPKFRDYWKAETSAKAAKLDWDAAFRTWLRNSRKFAPQSASRLRATAAIVQRDTGPRGWTMPEAK